MSGFRSYEVYQRARPADTTELIRPRQLTSAAYLADPYPMVAILREHYPCYRDWPANAFWVTRYDDVTSVIADSANYERRSRAWWCGRQEWGRDLGGEVDIQRVVERTIDNVTETIARRLIAGLRGDLVTEVFAPLWFEVICAALHVEPSDDLARWYLQMQRSPGAEPVARQRGLDALDAIAQWAQPLLDERGRGDGDDVLSVAARLGANGPDVAITMLEMDHSTVPGVLANLWFHLLTTPHLRDSVVADPMLVKSAVLETMRHSPPVVSDDRWTRHEVERFGRLLPAGALIRLSAAAANRDPRVFGDPDRFDPHRRDLCQREARGQFRADGLPSAISLGTGPPSKHPAVPEDRPRSLFAMSRDVIVAATRTLIDERPKLALAAGAEPTMRSLRGGEPHMCWSLPVVTGGR